jgi:uncharacterized protein (TIGR03084 family)
MDSTLLADLRDEHDALDTLVAAHDAAEWRTATPAAGWSVADTIEHLWRSELAATASVRERRDPLAGDPEPYDGLGPPELLDAWRNARTATLAAFADVDDRDRVPWGGREMAARSLATARLMETWAHGLDCFAAFGVAAVDTARLRHVAWLGWKTLPNAFALAQVTPMKPPEMLRVDVFSPDDRDTWSYGPSEAPDRVVGTAGDWCRLVTHRLRARPSHLVALGPFAEQSVGVARAFL